MGVLSAIMDVFGEVATWIVETVPTVTSLFWTPATSGTGGELTFLGVLAVAGLAMSVAFLLIGIIQRFLKFGS